MENNKHDYRDTVREAAELEENAQAAQDRERKIDAEAAYEVLAVNSAMGMLGMESQMPNLLQMELAQELLYKLDPETHGEDDEI